ncbi:hypothetical protein PR048_019006 [Dryococelus australis]|uniref:Uncharacterized protein n=1 Tax=Dryococelus australis TaxID=614101 RepID=A0ABQ9H298_9NEOP|nr:hypothetical protein PR048_019006 [Dryococelus australis]
MMSADKVKNKREILKHNNFQHANLCSLPRNHSTQAKPSNKHGGTTTTGRWFKPLRRSLFAVTFVHPPRLLDADVLSGYDVGAWSLFSAGSRGAAVTESEPRNPLAGSPGKVRVKDEPRGGSAPGDTSCISVDDDVVASTWEPQAVDIPGEPRERFRSGGQCETLTPGEQRAREGRLCRRTPYHPPPPNYSGSNLVRHDTRRRNSRFHVCSLLASRVTPTRRLSAGFLGDIPFPPPLHSSAAPYSPNFTLIGSQDLDVKNRPNLFTRPLQRTRQCSSIETVAMGRRGQRFACQQQRAGLSLYAPCLWGPRPAQPLRINTQRAPKYFTTATPCLINQFGTEQGQDTEKRGGDKGDTARIVKCAITTTRKALNWCLVLSSVGLEAVMAGYGGRHSRLLGDVHTGRRHLEIDAFRCFTYISHTLRGSLKVRQLGPSKSLCILPPVSLLASPPQGGSPAGSLRIFAYGNRAGRCRWSAGFFFGDLPFPPPPSFLRCSIFTSITLIGSKDVDFNSRPNLPNPLRGGRAVTIFKRLVSKVFNSP